jgi:glucose-1-phosphate thymidylyltransferase
MTVAGMTRLEEVRLKAHRECGPLTTVGFSMHLRGLVVVEDVPVEGGDALPVPSTQHVGNRPIAHHVLDALEAAGVHEVVVASSELSAGAVRTCFAAHETRGSAAQLEFVHQAEPLGFASALTLAAPLVEEAPCIVHAASGLLAEPLAPLATCLDGSGPDAVLMVHQAPSPDQRLSPATQSLLHLAELDPSRSALGVAGVWAFGPGAIRSAVGVVGSTAGSVVGSAADGGIDLAVMAQRITSAGGTIHVRVVDVWRAYRGEAVDLLELNRIVLDQITRDVPQAFWDGNRIEGRVRIHETATVTDSVLVGPVVIGPGASVVDAYIGPYTALGEGARIEGAEIERSIVSARGSVSHVGTRLTASVVGENARVFRDFSLPRALRLRIGDGAVVGLS